MFICRGKVVQVGDRDQIRRSPATPFVLNFIDDVNQLPSNCQFVKRMGLKADKRLVMCRPSRVEVILLTQFPLSWICLGHALLVETVLLCAEFVRKIVGVLGVGVSCAANVNSKICTGYCGGQGRYWLHDKVHAAV